MSKLYGVYKADYQCVGAFSGWVCTEENFKDVVSNIIKDGDYCIDGGKLLRVEKFSFYSKGLIKKGLFKLVIQYEDIYGDTEQITWTMVEIKTL